MDLATYEKLQQQKSDQSTLILAIDRSGSMYGNNICTVRKASISFAKKYYEAKKSSAKMRTILYDHENFIVDCPTFEKFQSDME